LNDLGNYAYGNDASSSAAVWPLLVVLIMFFLGFLLLGRILMPGMLVVMLLQLMLEILFVLLGIILLLMGIIRMLELHTFWNEIISLIAFTLK
jgi:hypothetical protein